MLLHSSATTLCADIVAKVFLGCRTKIPRAADAFHPGQCEGPYRFMQNPPPTFAVALNGDLVAEKSKNRLSRDFYAPSIFDFCNNIRSIADIARRSSYFRSVPRRDLGVVAPYAVMV